ncbi:MAG: glycosyltransferase [Kibdelosporangium sp.]
MRIVLLLKTNQGCMWTLPHVDALRARGHEVIAVLPAGDGPIRRALTEHDVPVVDSAFDFRFRPRWSTLAGLRELRRQLRLLAPDVVHYHLYASALAARLATVGSGVPRVYMVAGPLYLESRLIRAVERVLARMDTVIIAGSEFTARRYRELGRPVATTPVIPYGVDTGRFSPQLPAVRAATRAAHGIQPDDFLVIMVALVYAPKRLVHAGRGIKGHDVLLEAWRLFRQDHPGSRLLLLGSGFDDAGEQARQKLIAEFDLDRIGVIWLPTTSDVRSYYAAADLSVSPSRSDNHGAALEAGAMGLPSVVSDAGALPEAVPDQASWIVPAGDRAALAAALACAYEEHRVGTLAERGAQAQAWVLDRFDSGRTAEAVADVIERACPKPLSRTDSQRTVSLFVEARFGRTGDGQWAAREHASGPQAWSRYLVNGNQLRVVARADSRAGSAHLALPRDVRISPLPYYVGLTSLVRTLPRLVWSVFRAVARAEVVILRLPGVIGSLAVLAAWMLRRRYAVEVVGDPYDVLTAGVLGRGGKHAAPVVRWLMRRVVRGAAASQYVTEKTLQHRYPQAPGTPTVAVSNVRLTSGAFAAEPRQWQPTPFRIVTIGSQEQHYKGQDVLLRAIGHLADDGLPVSAVVVGGGRRHTELVSLVGALGLDDRVSFTGAVHDRDRIVELLDEASLFVLPSRTEGLPRVLVEAMARALPAVGSDVGGVPELIEASWLSPVDDDRALAGLMKTLLLNGSAWEQQSERNLRHARRYELGLLDERFRGWLVDVPGARRR